MGLKGAQAMARFAASGEKLKKFGKSWTHNVSLPVAGLGFIAGKMAIDFHQAMSLVQTQAGASAKEAKFLESSVLHMAENSRFGPTELADALFRVRSAGFKAHQALQVLKQGSNLSTLGGSDLEMTTKALTGAAKSLDLEKPGQMRGLAAEMNAIVGTGDMRMEELQDALSTGVLPAFVSAGMGIRDYGAALTVMTDRNVPAQVASTRLRTAITMLVPHSKKAEEALEGVGIQGEVLAELMRHKGLPTAIGYLAQHLDQLSKTKANRVMIEAFGGAKSSSTIETLVENVGELPEKWELIANGVGKYNSQIKVAEEQPGTQLAKAWSTIQVSLVKLGDELLPAIVPAVQKFASTFSTVAHIFTGLPPDVQAAAVGFLLLTGPVATGLGYFAGGIGRALVLTSKLVRAGKGLSIFSSALQAGQGLPTSTAMAMQGTGASAALQTAKGFAFALGPAVAAYGIGNIVTSATGGDWEDAGFEAGGAVAGGIAGFMLGGPMGAMLGVGLGSLGGELMSGLFGSGSKMISAQEKFALSAKRVKSALEGEHAASKALARSGSALITDRHRQKAASQEVRHAELALNEAREQFGPNSMQAIRDEVHLAKAGERRFAVTKKLHQQERKHGEALSIFKQENANAVLQERSRIKQLAGKRDESRQRRRTLISEGVTGARLIAADEALTQRTNALRKERTNLFKSWEEANKEAGPEWANFVRHANTKSLELGKGLKALHEEADGLRHALQKLSESPNPGLGPFKRNAVEQGIQNALGRNHRQEEELQPHRGGRPHHSTRNHGGRRRAVGLFLPQGRVRSVGGGGFSSQVAPAGDTIIHLITELDGKVVAESVTRHAKGAANRA
jgi:TP901 family phage tail tape measure protein